MNDAPVTPGKLEANGGIGTVERPEAPPLAHVAPDFYRALLDNMSEGVSLSSEDGTIVYTNPAEDRIFGYGPGELVGRHVSVQNAYPPDENARIVGEVIATLKRSGFWRGEWLNRRKDGSAFLTTSRISAVEIEGRPHWLCVQEDVTQEKAAEAALLASETRLRRAYQAARIGDWTWDVATGAIALSGEYPRLLALPPDRLPNDARTFFQMMVEEDRTRVEAEAAPILAGTKERLDTEFRIVRGDGQVRWLVSTAEAEGRLPDGRPERLVGVNYDITERRQAQTALQESEARFRNMADHSPVMMWVTDANGNCTYLNRAWYEFTGQREADALGFGWLDAVHPDDRGEAGRVFRESNAARVPFRLEYRVRRADGAYRWAIDAGSPRFDAAGTYAGYIGSVVDIHERRETEEKLRESERRFRTLADLMPAFVWFATPDGALHYLNDRWYRYTGQTREQALPNGWAATLHPDDAERTARAWAAARAAGSRYEIEVRYRRHDGAYRWYLARAEPLRDAEDAVVAWFGVSSDIHDARVAAEELQRLNATLESQVAERTAERDRMWRLSTDIMLVTDFDARMVAVNPAWTQILGWSEAELLAGHFLDFVHPDDIQATLAEIDRLKEGLTTLRFENRYRTKDGEYRWLSWTAVPAESFIHAVGRDVTAEKQTAAELELAQSALRQAQKMEAVGQLTGGIAHDFNNLLTGVLGSLELLGRRVEQGRFGDLDRYVSAASNSANRAAALTQRLLAFARRQPLDPKAVDANALLQGIDDLLRRTLGETIELETATDPRLGLTRCDPHQLESAIINLAINARDAMPAGGKLVIETANAHLDEIVSREQQVKAGAYVCIAVTDTGVGIPPEIIDRVVEPFFTTKPIGQGTGLGLSMIYGFARQSEGYLRIYSEPGHGTTVKLYLPRTAGADLEPAAAIRPAPRAPSAARDEVVLVVEDEDAVRDVVVEVLAELGCTTLEAFDGPSGLELLQSGRRIDLLVTDVGLPGLNGRQLADAARALRPGLKVLFMTGYAENATVASGFLEPGMQLITKPFAVSALGDKLSEMLAHPQS